MLSVCPYFHVHQPYRVKRYRVFDIGQGGNYFDEGGENDLNNVRILNKVARKSYLPANATLKQLLKDNAEFQFAFSFSGTVLEQLEEHLPYVLDTFKDLVNTGRVEVLGDTYHHSLAFFYSRPEFERQINLHKDTVRRIFGVTPRVLRNTELSYSNELGLWADKNGYTAILAEGWDPVLGWRSPNYVYRPKGATRAKLLLKNYRLSDDIAFRFGSRDWREWPLTADKFSSWVHAVHGDGNTVNLFMDFETFGEHQWEDTGIFHFLEALPSAIMKHPGTTFKTPSETARAYDAVGEIDVPHVLTWADTDRDLSAWVGNHIQRSAIDAIYALEKAVLATRNSKIIDDWRKLQTSDHFYYMCTKWFADGDVHAYFNPYDTPYDAYVSFMHALTDLKARIEAEPSRGVLAQLERLMVRIGEAFSRRQVQYQ